MATCFIIGEVLGSRLRGRKLWRRVVHMKNVSDLRVQGEFRSHNVKLTTDGVGWCRIRLPWSPPS